MFILIVAATLIIGASAILTAFPSNSAAVAGSRVILPCRTNTSKQLVWRQRLLNATEKDGLLDVIFTGNRFSNKSAQRYDIIRESDGQFDLKFNATLNHGNEYMCREPGGDDFSSQIVVLASETNCFVNGMPVTSNLILVDDEELIELKCNLSFAGRWSPSLEWSQQINSENDWMVIANQEETEKTDNICFTSTTLTLKAVQYVTNYMCRTRFLSSDRPKTTTAENVPDYSCSWTSPTFVLRTFYEINYRKQETEQNVWSLELGNKGWVFLSLILAVLLFIAILAIVSVALHFSVCRKKTRAEHSEEMSQPMRSSLNVESLVTAVVSEGNPTSMPAYEEVDIEPCSSRVVVVVHTTEGTPADHKYSALVKSDITPPKPHNYETINLPDMADDITGINARPQNEASDVRMECCPDYVNVFSH